MTTNLGNSIYSKYYLKWCSVVCRIIYTIAAHKSLCACYSVIKQAIQRERNSEWKQRGKKMLEVTEEIGQ